MSLARIPLFVWAQLITSGMVIFAMPSVMVCSTMLSMDRLANVNTQFFNPAEGGDALLWQHLFWFFAHPEVYIIFIPATGFVSTILPTFCRHRSFGYTALILSMVATAFIGFGVWVHHMFATPLPRLGQGLFTASSLMIVIPNGVQLFCWLALIGLGRPRLELPMMFVLGFFAVFLIGGLTGVMLASVSLNLQLHDTMFVVAHLHYVLIGGAVFPLFGAFYYWFPKWTGRFLNEPLGWVNWTLLFIGFNLTFFPLHQLGLQGMPRRVYTYQPDDRWTLLNQTATVGAFLIATSVLTFLINVVVSYRRGRLAGDNPWNASTLEWLTTSPPPPYNFALPPTVGSRDPLWDDDPETTAVVIGLADDARELLVTTAQEARPDHRYRITKESIWPFLMAVASAGEMVGLVFHPMSQVIGSIIMFFLLAAWFWPTGESDPIHHSPIRPLTDQPTSGRDAS
jgi:cytochrome c oxidase subunit I+III